MSGINLFEQQALALRAAATAVPLRRPAPAPARETPLAAAMRFIEGANVSQCGKVAAHLSARLFALEKMAAARWPGGTARGMPKTRRPALAGAATIAWPRARTNSTAASATAPRPDR